MGKSREHRIAEAKNNIIAKYEASARLEKEPEFLRKRGWLEKNLDSGVWVQVEQNYMFEKSIGFLRRKGDYVEYTDFSEGEPYKQICRSLSYHALDGFPHIKLSLLSVGEEAAEKTIVPEGVPECVNIELIFADFGK